MILLGGKKPGKSYTLRRLIPGHYPIFSAASRILPPPRLLHAGKLVNQPLKIKENYKKVCNLALSLQDQLALKSRTLYMQTRSK